MDDDALWALTRKGDADAFEALFRRHAKTIYNFCFRRLGEWALAEDAVSIVFLEVWRRRQTELPSGKVLPWLYGVATNVCRNLTRSRRRHAAALRRLPPAVAQPDFSDDVTERLEEQRDARILLRRLEQLPHREQDVLVLCAWLGLSYEDAALGLGLPVGTVRSRLSRARLRLRELDDVDGHEQVTSPVNPQTTQQ